MSLEITTAYRKAYNDNVRELSQQRGSKLRPYVEVDTEGGEDGFYDQVGPSEGHDITDTHGDTQYASTPHARRKVHPVPWEWADLITRQDTARTLNDPTNAYVRAAAYAYGRRCDRAVLTAAIGTAYTGKDGTTATAFPTSTNQIAHATSGMTVAKLLQAIEIFGGFDVDDELPKYLACGIQQITDLLNTTEVKSADYDNVKALYEGKVNFFAGFTFIRTQLVALSSTTRSCVAWVEGGILLDVSRDITTYIDVLPTKRHATQVRAEADIGATRMEEAKVVEIQCTET